MKTRGRVVAALALVSVVILFAFALWDRPADPVFGGKFASAWARDLINSSSIVRENAQAALQELGDEGVPQLRALLRQGSRIWEKPLLQLNRLLPFLDYNPPNPDACRDAAARMLGQLGEKARGAGPDLVASLVFDRSAGESERALVNIGAPAIPAVEGGLSARDAQVRFRAARLLREFHAAGESSVRALVSATRDKFPAVRREAVISLGAIVGRGKKEKHDSDSALNALLALAGDGSSEVRAAAMQALGKIAIKDLRLISSLRNGLCDEAVEVKLESAKSLWVLQQEPAEVLPVLISILETPERWRAAYVLGDMGAKAAPAIPALIDLLVQERVPRPFRTPPSAALALGKIGPQTVPELVSTLQHADSRVRMNALMAFSFMGRTAQGAVSDLLKLLEDENAEVRHTTALILASIGAEPKQIIAGLSDCLHAEDIYMRSAAAAHLREIAPDRTWFVPSE